jgi:hypothetical protein
VLVGPAARVPVNPSIGEYYAALLVPPGAASGSYLIRWTFRKSLGDEEQTVVQNFGVIDPSSAQTGDVVFTACQQDFINKFRIVLRDNNPDRNYHFRPPEQESTVGRYNRVFGYVWEDHELLCYLQLGLDYWNSFPPETDSFRNLGDICQRKPSWRANIIWAATVHAMFALATNWIHDEFDYSIGGISLSLEKSSKYQSLKDNAEQQFTKATDAKLITVKFIRGLQQPKFGFGVRSSFGPNVGRGVLSPRSFV